jgi:hypothetical protein
MADREVTVEGGVKNIPLRAEQRDSVESRRIRPVAPRKVKGENMKVTLRIVVAACLLLLVACGSSPQSLILGRWEVENAPTKMAAESKSDGTATISILGHTVQGTYKLNGTDELEWSMNGMSTKVKVKVTATELELTDNANRTIKYKRK